MIALVSIVSFDDLADVNTEFGPGLMSVYIFSVITAIPNKCTWVYMLNNVL